MTKHKLTIREEFDKLTSLTPISVLPELDLTQEKCEKELAEVKDLKYIPHFFYTRQYKNILNRVKIFKLGKELGLSEHEIKVEWIINMVKRKDARNA